MCASVFYFWLLTNQRIKAWLTKNDSGKWDYFDNTFSFMKKNDYIFFVYFTFSFLKDFSILNVTIKDLSSSSYHL